MIHSKVLKDNTSPWQEDPKTSFFFETLLMLHDDLFWDVLKDASACNGNAGNLLHYDFWPKWDVSNVKEIENKEYVEPDLFIQFENLDVLIEAKRDEKGQCKGQWDNELTAYYSQDKFQPKEKVVFVALGGNTDEKGTKAHNLRNESISCDVYKTSWVKLLHSAKTVTDACAEPQIKRLIGFLEYGCNELFHIRDFKWFDSLNEYDVMKQEYAMEMADFQSAIDCFAKGIYTINKQNYAK